MRAVEEFHRYLVVWRMIRGVLLTPAIAWRSAFSSISPSAAMT